MAIGPGTRVGPYEVTALIGEGGMGKVWRAHHAALKRDDALKVLPDAFATDPERLARFQREAQVLASLNHPNIAHVYGLEQADGVQALVMELVEGPTLAERIAQGRIPLDEALPITKQIADAVEAAHEQGIIHRDLKPANIKLRPDGTVKLLDFGLAKAIEGSGGPGGGIDLMNSPTITSPAMRTGVGMILGTAAYMSPEQAKGRVVDKRSDVWAFGAVLYEMLTARRAFEGIDVSDTLARVLMKEPDWTALPATVPAAVVTVIRRCLQKDRKQRVRDIGDVSLALEGAFETVAPHTTATATASTPGRHAWMAAVAAALVGMIALGVPALRHVRETPPSATRLVRVSMDLAPADRLGGIGLYGRPSRTAFAVAPDGATIVFVGEVQRPSPRTMLYRRPLADAQAVAIPGTEGADYPFFSPDGRWVGFGAGNTLKKVALSGGPPLDICDFTGLDRLRGASWGSAGVIAFATGGLWTVSDAGGKPDALFESNVDIEAVASPAMLPDGQTVLFTVVPGTFKWEDAHVDAINVMTKQRKTLLTNAADARYFPTGHLVFVRNAALLAVPFDATRVDVTGAPVPLLAGIMQSTNAVNSNDETGMGQFALSASGTLLYASGDRYPTATSVLMRVDRKGAGTKLTEITGTLGGPRLDSAGARVVAFKTGDGSRSTDIWLYDLPSGTPTRLTSTVDASWPLFSLDGKSVTSSRAGSESGIYAWPLNGSPAQRLIEGAGLFAASWSSDGKWLAYLQTVGGVRQIFVRPAREGTPEAGEPRQFAPSTFEQLDAEFSPDSRWIAYSSTESGAMEVYVQAFPGPGRKHRISPTGGINPAWSRDGRELFYFTGRSGSSTVQMLAADVSTTGDFTASVPRQLFEGPYFITLPLRSYDVTADGQFIMMRLQLPPDQPVTTLNVVLGWAEELKAKVPAGK